MHLLTLLAIITAIGWTLAAVIISLERRKGFTVGLNQLEPEWHAQRRGMWEFAPAQPGEFDELILKNLDLRSSRLQELGFEVLGDVTARAREPLPAAPISPGPLANPLVPQAPETPLGPPRITHILRVLVHREQGCLARVSAGHAVETNPQGQLLLEMGTLFRSLTGTTPSDTIYTTAHSTPPPTAWLQRHPRHLSTGAPSTSPAEMFQLHLQRREQIAQLGGLAWLRNLSVQTEIEAIQLERAALAAFFHGLSLKAYASAVNKLGKPTGTEWLGQWEEG